MFRNRIVCWLILIAFCALIPPVYHGAKLSWERQANRVEDWLPPTFEETQQLIWFIERFGSDELLMISWNGCTLDNPNVAKLAEELKQPTDFYGQEKTWFREVFTGSQSLDYLTEEPLELSSTEARQRLEGWLVGKDGETTCLVALVSDSGIQNRAAAVDYVWRTAERLLDKPRAEIRMAGPTYDSVAIDAASKNSLLEFNIWSWLICIALLYICLRSIRLAWFVFVVAFVSEHLSLAIMHYSFAQLDSILLLVANLTFVLGIAGGIHLVNYIRESITADEDIGACVSRAVWKALLPCTLAGGTTALGMFSLSISQLSPIRAFGWFGALGILAGAVLLLTVLPACITVFPPRKWQSDTPSESKFPSRLLAAFVAKQRIPILITALGVLVAGIGGMRYLETSIDMRDFFQPKAKIIQDYNWLEEHIGYLVPMEIVLKWPQLPADQPAREQSEELLRRLRVLDQLNLKLKNMDGVGTAISSLNFLPDLPSDQVQGFRQISQRRATLAMLLDQRSQLQQTGYLVDEDDAALWRLSLRVSAQQKIDYGNFLDQVASETQSVLDQQEQPPEVVICGGLPLIYKAQSQLLSDLLTSYSTALATITLIMILLQRSILGGVLIMLPNVLPTAIVFGALGALGREIEIGGVLTASAALGIAVDDSMHFLSNFRTQMAKHNDVSLALEKTFQTCGVAMIQTTLVCTLGLLVFALSQFVPIARFAWLMFMLLSTALLCDLILLPAILAFTKPGAKPDLDET
ncbi:efflux RND transporter permease subunit [Bremerella sp. T1]|uniref:efflux RND transporter permease subunit n=1 Tax=Bremerella sp. TYQ1 TaxID=3119568 RepID=UPI001CC9B8BA|nr:MMPL family transporter [Bremerella volcania]UBM37141.1 MMPL family transporter [Bremerella volcania]